jgi:hypothetical protein
VLAFDLGAPVVSTGRVRPAVHIAVLALVALSLAACGGGAASGDAGQDTRAVCALDPLGTFVFHVTNVGTTTLFVQLDCRGVIPISLSTPEGRLPTAPGAVTDTCGFTCDDVYAGHVTAGACMLCSTNGFQSVAPGDTANVSWDRRVYRTHQADVACTPAPGPCALGIAVAPTTTQLGALVTCPAGESGMVSCLAPKAQEFTVDTSGAEATIDVSP